MKQFLFITLLFLGFFPLTAQVIHPEYRLLAGKEYALKVVVSQNTITESNGLQENISLDIAAGYHFIVDSIGIDGSYFLTAFYRNLAISMVAPAMNIRLNAETESGKILQNYLDELEAMHWNLELSPSGNIIAVSGLNNLFPYGLEEKNREYEVIVKTLNEAFGEEAIRSFSNIILNLYPEYPVIGKWQTTRKHYFNTRAVELKNNWYYSSKKDGVQLVQGLGVIESFSPDTITINDIIITSSVSGNQTYDYQTDPLSGWLISGTSRQRIVVTNKIVNDPSFPGGLEVPVYTETIYTIIDASPSEIEEAINTRKKHRKTN